MNKFERRRSIRIEVDVNVNYDKDSFGRSKNFSKTGLCIIINKSFVKGSFLKLMFSLPGLKEITVIGNVAWSFKKEAGDYEIGIEFWYIEEADRKMIMEYIDTQINTESGDVNTNNLYN